MTISPARDLSQQLSRNAEAVCRHYLSRGRRHGRYWLVGDVRNTPGRSMFVRLSGPEFGPGAAGRWTDAASGEHGDLLDLIRENLGLFSMGEVLEEARRFLHLPAPPNGPGRPPDPPSDETPRSAIEAARRLFRAGRPLKDTVAAAYLAGRGLGAAVGTPALRFHPRCYHRAGGDGPTLTCPALLAAVTDLGGEITGVHRTWLAPDGSDKAALAEPRRARGHLLGNGVRFGGPVRHVLVAGEGIETVLSLRLVLPGLPMVAALSANHLAALAFPLKLGRLYVARDGDAEGVRAVERLRLRGAAAGIVDVRELVPLGEDFNADLMEHGSAGLARTIAAQLHPADRARYLVSLTMSPACA